MKISEMIELLQDAQRKFGDHPVFTWDGEIADIRIDPGRDGAYCKQEDANEISLEIITEQENGRN